MRICGESPRLEITTKESQADAFADTEPRKIPIPGHEARAPDVRSCPGPHGAPPPRRLKHLVNSILAGVFNGMVAPRLLSHGGSLG